MFTKLSSLRLCLLILLAAGSSARAQDAAAPPQIAAPSAIAPVMGTLDGLLLLKNGETLEGRISRSGDYYLVITPTAEIQVRIREVEGLCRDLEEVVAKKLALVNTRSADSYLALAQWCIDKQLYGHAARALTEAIKLDDLHPRISLLERRMKAAMTAPSPVAATPKPAEPKYKNEEIERSAKSIGAESLHEFTVRVQPLMMNYCATAGCHGPRATSTFQLERVYLNERTDPRIARANLHAVLKQVDRANPSKSALLNVPITAHGGAKKPIFTAHNSEHYRQLAGWVGRLAPQRQAAPLPTSTDVVSAANTLQQRMPLSPPSAAASNPTPTANTIADGMQLQSAVTLDAANSADVPLQAGPVATPPAAPPATGAPRPPSGAPGVDPFDPEVFNRRHEAEKK